MDVVLGKGRTELDDDEIRVDWDMLLYEQLRKSVKRHFERASRQMMK